MLNGPKIKCPPISKKFGDILESALTKIYKKISVKNFDRKRTYFTKTLKIHHILGIFSLIKPL